MARSQSAPLLEQRGFKGYLDDQPRLAPEKFGEPFDLLNHPVVGISWYEALAFTRWLNKTSLPSGWQAHLPSEADWEKAARGGLQILAAPILRSLKTGFDIQAIPTKENPYPQRLFPWGDKADPNMANYNESQTGSTCTPGCFASGASPYGCMDMSGNVWEWTNSLFQQYPYQADDGRENLDDKGVRVVRGGSFYNYDGTCAAPTATTGAIRTSVTTTSVFGCASPIRRRRTPSPALPRALGTAPGKGDLDRRLSWAGLVVGG